MYHSFLIHSSADGHLGCFHVLAIINSTVPIAILMCQNAFLLTWNSCVRGPGRMNRYFLRRVVWNENKIWVYWGNLAKSLPSEGCQLLWLLPISSFGFCTFSNFAEYLSMSNLDSGAIFFFLIFIWRLKSQSFFLPSQGSPSAFWMECGFP